MQRPPRLTFALLTLFAVVLHAGCSGSHYSDSNLNPAPPPQLSELAASLPDLPQGSGDVRQAVMLDSDTLLGDTFIDSQNTTAAAGEGQIVSLYGGSAGLGWALYQLAARPAPAVPYRITVNARFLDPAPLLDMPYKGYWVAWADYAAGTWRFSGPYTGDQARLSFPATGQPVSGGGLVYVAVVAYGGYKCNVHSVQVGYDAGVGYEDYMLGAAQGVGVGDWPDLELDSAGNVQIAYLAGSGPGGTMFAQLRIASASGSNWELEDVPTAYPIRSLRFARGDVGRRALAVIADSSSDMHLLLDDGSGGGFAVDLLLNAGGPDILPDVVFVNGADDPLGELDTVLCAYVMPAAAPNIQTQFYAQTLPAGAPMGGNILPAPSRPPGHLSLGRRANKQAVVGVPTAPLHPQWDAVFGEYSAVTATFSFLLGPAWNDLNLEDDDDYTPYVEVRELPGGELAAGCLMQDGVGWKFARLSGGLWSDELTDRVYCATNGRSSFEVLPDGRVVLGAQTGQVAPVLWFGTPGDGLPWTAQYLEAAPYSALALAVATDSAGNCHLAGQDVLNGMLWYTVRDPAGNIDPVGVDLGGEDSSISTPTLGLVNVPGEGGAPDHLYVFYVDISHFKLLVSENAGGTWLTEAEIVPLSVPVQNIYGAGYLEETDRLWLVYDSPLDHSVWVASRPLASPAWSAFQYMDIHQEGVYATDDESTIGIISPVGHPMDSAMGFGLTDGVAVLVPPQPITFNRDLLDFPLSGAWDETAQQWLVLGYEHSNNACLLYRASGPELWEGPITVAQQPGLGVAFGVGITFDTSGVPLVTVWEQAAGSTLSHVNVYRQDPSGISFSYYATVGTLDEATEMTWSPTIQPDADGEPLVAWPHKLIADPTWKVEIYTPQGGGSWLSTHTWNSPIEQIGSFPGAVQLQQGSNGPLLATSELNSASPNLGRMFLHYPW